MSKGSEDLVFITWSDGDWLNEDGEIVLNEGMTILKSQYDLDAELQRLREAGMDEAGIRQCQKYIEIFCKDH